MSRDLVMRAYEQPDEKSEKMAAAWFACKQAGVSPPVDVEEFFDWEEPSPHGTPMVNSKFEALQVTEEISKEGFHGFALKVDELPDNVKTIVIGISY